ncbi:Rrf2 family transcriptional regulator [Clostridium sp. CM028]|uniref:RrF2 family transcriptional regulator n=1 Tax=Clostridium TaxID=1485 RepID=UPI0013EE7C26|nr:MULTISPECIES: Rrf2 family transcriptional regulator [Clostridium]MBU3093483.1 Rrf2 family transcriptional regulator [Clostridium sp. CF011]MBW9146688.1 Rrf2 family transcriptional regulator [Clostridium sp. CM027]MBW9148169.1 Rrf2 family transcriptional regulator [Clostridium sp. CM028]MBZ9607858.1 Rrf2 family transcriptional regulator [Clostridium estertheticum]UVE41649.1 Rrf2 family transcriptional regulator [Clostridium sp. CM027]
MKITQEADYALRVVIYLCKLGYGEKIEAKVISEKEGIPLRFLLKLLGKLIQANILKSYRGVKGGYAINKLPEQITLKGVIEAIDGPICVNRCVIEPSFCNLNRSGECIVHRAMTKVQKNLNAELESINFKQLVEGEV